MRIAEKPATTPRAISFDLDNTLFDRPHSLRVFTARLMAEFSGKLLGVTSEEVFTAIAQADGDGYRSRQHAMEHLRRATFWKCRPDLASLRRFWDLTFPLSVVPYEDSRSALEECARLGLKLALISNGWSALQRQKLQTLGFDVFFDVILIGEEVGMEKPDAAVFDHAVRQLQTLPSQIWHVGDDPVNDVHGSSNAGLLPVWLATTQNWPLATVQPGITVKTLAEVVTLLKAAG